MFVKKFIFIFWVCRAVDSGGVGIAVSILEFINSFAKLLVQNSRSRVGIDIIICALKWWEESVAWRRFVVRGSAVSFY